LLGDILRNEWGFEGHIVSDCGALRDLYEGHGVAEDAVEAAALALKSGVNVNCGSTYTHLEEAVERGLVTEADIDASLAYLLRTRFRLGLFDPPELVPYTSIPTDVINCDEHKALAHEAARKCVVMLKNENNALPISNETESVYIIGPNASNIDVLLGNYYGLSADMTTIVEGITGKMAPGTFVQYRPGCLLERDNVNPMDWSTYAAQQSDVIIAVMGISGLLEGEEGESILSPTKGDRLDIRLPANQVNQVKKLRNGYDNPIILVLTGGSPIDISEVADLVDAILFVWYPGEAGGKAVADIIFGDANPSGRLPISFPKSIDDLPPYEDYSMKGRTYRYMQKDPMYPFGFGLSYSEFGYEILGESVLEMEVGEKLTIEVEISNKGSLPGDEVVQLYISDLLASAYVPITTLRGFRRIHLEAGETKTVSFTVSEEMLEFINEDGLSVIEPGEFRISIGGSSPGSRSSELGAATHAEIMLKLS
jgi:beta-glucosidase